MSALSALKPRTTPTGPARFVPYSQYGTPTTPYDYSTLYSNLGVSPFGGGVVSPTPTSATPTPTIPATAPATAPTAPTGGLPTGAMPIAPTAPITAPTTPTAPATPTYFSDADGNIYDADGNLVFDVTSGAGSIAGSEGTVSTTPSVSSGLAVSSLPTQTIADSTYSYGTPVNPSDVLNSKSGGLTTQKLALGGQPITDNLNVPVSNRPFQNVPSIQGRGDYRTGAYVEGAGDGQSDDIPAMLADGEYVIDAETVAQLGNGSNKAGAKVLDEFRKNIRAHKRSAPHDKIPPKSKSPLAYLKGAK